MLRIVRTPLVDLVNRRGRAHFRDSARQSVPRRARFPEAHDAVPRFAEEPRDSRLRHPQRHREIGRPDTRLGTEDAGDIFS